MLTDMVYMHNKHVMDHDLELTNQKPVTRFTCTDRDQFLFEDIIQPKKTNSWLPKVKSKGTSLSFRLQNKHQNLLLRSGRLSIALSQTIRLQTLNVAKYSEALGYFEKTKLHELLS